MTHGTPPGGHDPVAILGDRFIRAIHAAFPELTGDVDPLIVASKAGAKNAATGDFQCNVAMGLSKRVGKPPREVAKAIVSKVDVRDVALPLDEASIGGPGFINITLDPDALSAMLAALDTPSLGVTPSSHPERIVVDLFGVNLAKQMHVGHLRSPFIGDAIARTLERLGHTVIRQNHVGDWGLPIAMVTARLMRQQERGEIDLNTLTLDDLDRNYKLAQAECQRDMAGLEAAKRFGMGPKAIAELEAQVEGATEAFTHARETLVALQRKEPRTFGVWQRLADVTMSVCLSVAKRLNVNVTAEHSAGESSYAEELPGLVADLESRGVAQVDQGALVVRLEEPTYGGIKEPCLIRKTDGGYLYATTDLAAIRRRVQTMHATRLIYVIDARQNLHLRQVFGASAKAGYATIPGTDRVAVMEHAAFGSVLGEDGRPFKTRSGESVNLQSLIDEAVSRARVAVESRAATAEPPLTPDEISRTAEAIGVTAMKYADLCNDRIKDYVFSFDRMLSFEGNTGPYLLYALVRIKSIFRKAAARGIPTTQTDLVSTPITLQEPAEKALSLTLLGYSSALEGVTASLEPHRLCTYLFTLAGTFSTFFDQCPVLAASDEDTRRSRLRLCHLTARVLEDGLGVLGMPTVERM
ncbi:MAG: arginine--tRNA ligase [Phycisphaerales bacterium]|nr:MAG: arginine--tRNA ligase [Phycisphaerales bacterium]